LAGFAAEPVTGFEPPWLHPASAVNATTAAEINAVNFMSPPWW
jgi:hypothetical protein